ncbi:hypothetical protein V8E54_008541 [Elaphomyces granulatus]
MELVLLTTDSYSALQWPEKGTTAEELFTRAKANGYQRGAHREKDSIRDDNNHTEKTKRDQDRFLYVYVNSKRWMYQQSKEDCLEKGLLIPPLKKTALGKEIPRGTAVLYLVVGHSPA